MGIHRESTAIGLLGFLTDGPRHGYAIYRELSDPDGLWLVWRMKQSQLYALLSRLEEEGKLVSELEPQAGRPPRRMYRLTPEGRAAYRRWLKTPVDRGRQFRLDLLVKLFFARRQGIEAVEALLDAQRMLCREWLGELQIEEAELREGAAYQRVVHQYRSGQIQAMLGWIDSCRAELVSTTIGE